MAIFTKENQVVFPKRNFWVVYVFRSQFNNAMHFFPYSTTLLEAAINRSYFLSYRYLPLGGAIERLHHEIKSFHI